MSILIFVGAFIFWFMGASFSKYSLCKKMVFILTLYKGLNISVLIRFKPFTESLILLISLIEDKFIFFKFSYSLGTRLDVIILLIAASLSSFLAISKFSSKPSSASNFL